MPELRAWLRVGVEGVHAVMLGGDENDVVGTAPDAQTGNPQRLRVGGSIHGTRKQLSEAAGGHRQGGQRKFVRVGAVARKIVVVGEDPRKIGDRDGSGGALGSVLSTGGRNG